MLSLLEKLKSTAQTAKASADEAARIASETAEAAKLAAQKATNLQKDVDRAKLTLATADEQLSFFENRAAELRESALSMWGRSDLYQGVTITSSPIYGSLAQCLAAIEDFKRVRPILLSRVEAAESALADFADDTIS
jgi:hypothetical protein